jgi:tetratricopeptide (TPR) repeat protein
MTQKRRAAAQPKAARKPPQPVRHQHVDHVHDREGGCGCEELDEAQIGSALPMERLLRVLRHAVHDRNFGTQRDVEDFLAKFSEDDYNQALARLTAGNPIEQAQQLAYEAIMDAETDEHAVALAERALALDPGCVDAQVILAEIQCIDRENEFVDRLEEIVERAAEALAPRLKKKHLWSVLEVRPYLRAKFRLGDALRATGQINAAIGELEDLLELNPEDQQAAREPLLSCYLALDMRKEARQLLKRFPSDESAVFHWGRVLERFLSGDRAAVLRELAAARGQNPHVESYLTFRKNPPDGWERQVYTAGDPEEAIHCHYVVGMAWAHHPDAIKWLRSAQ